MRWDNMYLIKIYNLINKILNFMGYEIIKTYSINTKNLNFQHFLKLYFSKVSPNKFFFIEIGANDGKINDPIYEFVIKYDLPGILVEPQKEPFKRLKQNYINCNNLIFVNGAISKKDGYKTLYSVKESFHNIYRKVMGQNPTGITSFNKDHVKKNIERVLKSLYHNKDIYRYIKERKVKCLSLKTLIREYNIDKVDLLVIDTEGFDFEIIKMVNFDKISPTLIIYESQNLIRSDQILCEKYLQNKGYNLFRHLGDVVAFK